MANKKRLCKDKTTKSLRAITDNSSVVLEDRQESWKYWMEIYRSPKAVARELRQIASWLEKL